MSSPPSVKHTEVAEDEEDSPDKSPTPGCSSDRLRSPSDQTQVQQPSLNLETLQTFGMRDVQTPRSSSDKVEPHPPMQSWNNTQKKNETTILMDSKNAKYRTQCKHSNSNSIDPGMRIEVLKLPLEILSDTCNQKSNVRSGQMSYQSKGSYRFKDWLRSKSREKDNKYRSYNLI